MEGIIYSISLLLNNYRDASIQSYVEKYFGFKTTVDTYRYLKQTDNKTY